jgi:hypothetical protein
MSMSQKLVINLFTDNTMLYLSEYDSLDEIMNLINTWCKASGTKFNKEKTEIIPIGTRAHWRKSSEPRNSTPQMCL